MIDEITLSVHQFRAEVNDLIRAIFMLELSLHVFKTMSIVFTSFKPTASGFQLVIITASGCKSDITIELLYKEITK